MALPHSEWRFQADRQGVGRLHTDPGLHGLLRSSGGVSLPHSSVSLPCAGEPQPGGERNSDKKWRKRDEPEQGTQRERRDICKVVKGTHAGKSGTVGDIKTSKSGDVTITVVQLNGERFKTLARTTQR